MTRNSRHTKESPGHRRPPELGAERCKALVSEPTDGSGQQRVNNYARTSTRLSTRTASMRRAGGPGGRASRRRDQLVREFVREFSGARLASNGESVVFRPLDGGRDTVAAEFEKGERGTWVAVLGLANEPQLTKRTPPYSWTQGLWVCPRRGCRSRRGRRSARRCGRVCLRTGTR
jgi:hypothetical protein